MKKHVAKSKKKPSKSSNTSDKSDAEDLSLDLISQLGGEKARKLIYFMIWWWLLIIAHACAWTQFLDELVDGICWVGDHFVLSWVLLGRLGIKLKLLLSFVNLIWCVILL